MAQGKGPGTNTRGGVTSTMGNAMKVSSSPGEGNGMSGPFDKKHDLGGGGIPVTMYDKSMPDPKVPKPGEGQGNTPILGGQGGQKRPGTK